MQTDVRGGVLHRAEWLDFVRNRKSELQVDCDSVEVQIYWRLRGGDWGLDLHQKVSTG